MNTRMQEGPGPTEEARPASNPPSSLNRQVKNWFRQTKSEALRWMEKNDAILSFKDLYLKESRQLGDEADMKSVSVVTGTAGEPWIAFTPKDRFGLALSGGGIRSATFNLGLLQALAQLGVLVIVWYFWALLLASLTIDSSWSARAMGVSLLVYLVGAEFWWGRSGKSEHNERETWGYCAGCGVGLALAFIGWAARKLWLPGAEFDQSAALLEP